MTNKERREYDKKRYWADIENSRIRIRLKARKRRLEDPEKAKWYGKRFKEMNPEAVKQHGKNYYTKHKVKILQHSKLKYMVERDKIRSKTIAKTYGITVEQYDDMFKRQGEKCAICGIHQKDLIKRLFIDHDHKSGKIRELLCIKCNGGLGMFEDDIGLLKKALIYLTRHA